MQAKTLPPHSSQINPHKEESWWVLKALVIATFGGLILFSTMHSSLIREHTIPPEEVIGRPIPSGLDPALSFRTSEGLEGEFILPAENTRLSVVIAPRTGPSQPLPDTLTNLIKENLNFPEKPSPLPPFLLKFLSSQVSFRRAQDISSGTITIQGKTLSSESFRFKGEYYLMTLIPLRSQDMLVFSFNPRNPVNSDAISKTLNEMRVIQSDILMNPTLEAHL